MQCSNKIFPKSLSKRCNFSYLSSSSLFWLLFKSNLFSFIINIWFPASIIMRQLQFLCYCLSICSKYTHYSLTYIISEPIKFQCTQEQTSHLWDPVSSRWNSKWIHKFGWHRHIWHKQLQMERKYKYLITSFSKKNMSTYYVKFCRKSSDPDQLSSSHHPMMAISGFV